MSSLFHIVVRSVVLFCIHIMYVSRSARGITMNLVVSRLVLLCCFSQFQSTMALSTMSAAAAAAAVKRKNIVVIGGGIQGVSVAYHLAKQGGAAPGAASDTTITILEAIQPASAASGKGGGFMARGWGDGSPTQRLHELSFDMYEELAAEVQCTSYRKLPVLSVAPGTGRKNQSAAAAAAAKSNHPESWANIMPAWLDQTAVGRVSPMGFGDDTAQITPKEFVDCMLASSGGSKIRLVKGVCTGIETRAGSEPGTEQVTGVQYRADDGAGDDDDAATTEPGPGSSILLADAVIVAAGPWSCAAEDWFHGAVQLPMEGIKSTSIVWKKPENFDVDATALFCGEDNRFSTHLEVYPRPDGTIYICGIGGSDYITTDELKKGAFRGASCQPNEVRVEAAKASFQEMSTVYKEMGELDRTQACMRPCPPDAMPYMGSVPGYEGAFINAGHNCWGIAWAPACGKAIAELVLTGKSTSVDLAPFDPARFTPANQRGCRGRKKQGESVGEQW